MSCIIPVLQTTTGYACTSVYALGNEVCTMNELITAIWGDKRTFQSQSAL